MISDRIDFGPIRGARMESREQQIETAVHDFEAQLLRFLVKGMREAFLEDKSGEQGLYSDFAEETLTQALAGGRDGFGLGLAKGVRERLLQQASGSTDGAAISPLRELRPTGARPPSFAPLPGRDSLGHAKAKHLLPVATGAASVGSTPLLPAIPLSRPHPAGEAPRVNSGFGRRIDPLHGAHRFHRGLDLRAAVGTPVHAAAAGTVLRTEEAAGYGRHVVVGHPGGYETVYAHLSTIDVKAGDAVAAGSPLGAAGATGRASGPHLHFELLAGGQPIDPTHLLDGGGGWQWPLDPNAT